MELLIVSAEVWKYVLLGLEIGFLIIVVLTIILLILENRNPVKTMAWILAIILLPVMGVILFYFFGQNYRKKRIYTRKEISDFRQIEKLAAYQASNLAGQLDQTSQIIKDKSGIIRLLLNSNKAPITQKNRVKVLNDGQETFPEIYSALESAQNHIHLEYYIFEEGVVGNRIRDILIEKAKAGVEVRMIFDDVGSWDLDDDYFEGLTKAGCEVEAFGPVRFPRLATRINYRNHRKIIVVDGKTGFVGGLNIADKYLYGSPEIGMWRDTHLRIDGAAVASLQTVFLTDWHFVSNKLLDNCKYFPTTECEEDCLVQIVTSGPDSDWASIMQAYLYTIASAREYVYISSPYFMPNDSILNNLKTISLSGVDVRIILPSRSDSRLAWYGSLSYIRELLEADISVYFYNKGFTHGKLLVVDDVISSVGTANMDIRSFDQNLEVNAIVYNEKIAESIKESFLNDLGSCDKVVYEEFIKRPFTRKVAESIARIFGPLL
jgi:cardiolipin synthase